MIKNYVIVPELHFDALINVSPPNKCDDVLSLTARESDTYLFGFHLNTYIKIYLFQIININYETFKFSH